MTPIKAIRQKCLKCKENHYKQIKECEATECPLYEYRFGVNPNGKRNLTDEQREVLRNRMLKIRENRKSS